MGLSIVTDHSSFGRKEDNCGGHCRRRVEFSTALDHCDSNCPVNGETLFTI
jgi:hypothetical protein